MALTDDQRAMLRLLAQSDESYEDIAALKGISVEQVKAEVRAALAEVANEPAQKAPAPVEAPEPTEEPAPPVEPRPSAAAEEPAPATKPARRKPARPRRPALRAPRPQVPVERRRIVMVAGGALGAVALILIAIALIGGSDSDSDGASATEAANVADGQSSQLTQAQLKPVAGQSGEGQAIFGRVGKKEIVLQVAAQGLKPAEGGQSYTVWLYRSPKVALRIGAVKVGDSGRLGAQLPIPAELLAYVGAGAFRQVYLSRTDDAAFEAALAKAKKQKSLPPYTGETVLTGEIVGPVVKNAGNGS